MSSADHLVSGRLAGYAAALAGPTRGSGPLVRRLAAAALVAEFVPKAAASRAGEGGRGSAVGPADPRVQREHRQRDS